MKIKISLTFIFLLSWLNLLAQGKFYITPQIGYISGSYSGVDCINRNQNLFTTRNFQWKQSIIGLKASYYKNKFETSIGIEEGVYASGFYYGGDRSIQYNVISKHSLAQRCKVIFNEYKQDAFSWNIKMPKWLRSGENSEDSYLIVSRIMPLIGLEYRILPRNGKFVNHLEEFRSTTTIIGSIPFAQSYNSYNRSQLSIRTGLDWVFYDGEKRKFIITLMYSIAFKDAGYYNYRFYYDTPQEFQYRNRTRGNGISLKVGVPFKILEIKAK